MKYRRSIAPGGIFFFTVVTFQRRKFLAQEPAIDLLRQAFRSSLVRCPFKFEAAVILPNHLHMIWRLPDNDRDYPVRWRLVKSYFTHRWECSDDFTTSVSRRSKRERSVWQRRYWEHLIRDEEDWRRHVDYFHYNPVKHGLAKTPGEWPHTSFHRFVMQGMYDQNWAGGRGIWEDERLE
jgi:putative transposase